MVPDSVSVGVGVCIGDGHKDFAGGTNNSHCVATLHVSILQSTHIGK